MGLSGPKTRRKLGQDPNNTKWSRDETTFGQRILRAHGWEPGKFLGSQNGAYTELHSAASFAPIKVALKDDTLGLGAKQRQKQSTECTGLDGFKDLLGRLNGKSEDAIETERKTRSDFKTSLYVERRFGIMRFVSGGLLVGDQLQALAGTDPATMKSESTGKSALESTDEGGRSSKRAKKEKKSKKRKAEETDGIDNFDASQEKKRSKRSKGECSQEEQTEDFKSSDSSKGRKKSKKEKEKYENGDDDSKLKKKEKKPKSSKNRSNPMSESDLRQQVSETPSDKEKEDKRKRKKEKKEKRLLKSNAAEDTTSTENPTPSSITLDDSGSSTPTGTRTSTPQTLASRHNVRARYIASKRLALTDMQALNQLTLFCMILSVKARSHDRNILAKFLWSTGVIMIESLASY